MKTIHQLRNTFSLHPQECSSSIMYFKRQTIDWNVYLTSREKNLQRDFVWTIEQKRELIWSMILGRHIPHVSMINTIHEIYQIIDGKQRLSTMIDFVNNKFTLFIDNTDYLFDDLPKDYQLAIDNYYFRYYIIYENETTVTDDDKINWFKFINFAGTPQDSEHINSLK